MTDYVKEREELTVVIFWLCLVIATSGLELSFFGKLYQFDYLVYYASTITGKLNVGSITDLSGIQVKRFLFWFNVDEIKVDLPSSDSIYFSVGIINKKLDIDQFETVRSCTDNALCGGFGFRGGLKLWVGEIGVAAEGVNGRLEFGNLVVDNESWLYLRMWPNDDFHPEAIVGQSLPMATDEVEMLITE
ncbi:hypothetical protein CTI12_AA186360 [Artemisia annua]|uniref:Uncharacterized protein n=1 Tax=Artemisia annua TaxID=35608 RepID=A0A2U1P734_ARTAN|nr:hypothetical protein CTI12_AA186360 [Artemisia annua]